MREGDEGRAGGEEGYEGEDCVMHCEIDDGPSVGGGCNATRSASG